MLSYHNLPATIGSLFKRLFKDVMFKNIVLMEKALYQMQYIIIIIEI